MSIEEKRSGSWMTIENANTLMNAMRYMIVTYLVQSFVTQDEVAARLEELILQLYALRPRTKSR
jgi:hypothetical protein